MSSAAALRARLVAGVPLLVDAVARAVAQWEEQEPPETPPETPLFSVIGTTLVERSGEISDAELASVFAEIERALTTEPDALRDLVATGLLEGLLARGDRRPEECARVLRFAGPAAITYCRAWDEFCGVHREWTV